MLIGATSHRGWHSPLVSLLLDVQFAAHNVNSHGSSMDVVVNGQLVCNMKQVWFTLFSESDSDTLHTGFTFGFTLNNWHCFWLWFWQGSTDNKQNRLHGNHTTSYWGEKGSCICTQCSVIHLQSLGNIDPAIYRQRLRTENGRTESRRLCPILLVRWTPSRGLKKVSGLDKRN